MDKELGILIGGIFVGVVAAEIMHKAWPGGLNKLCAKVGKMTHAAKEAFAEGYRESLSTGEPASASAEA